MPCDICSSTHRTQTVQASTVSHAASNGFNPFSLGLMPTRLARLAASDYPGKWRLQAISGELSHTDWALCTHCHQALAPYL